MRSYKVKLIDQDDNAQIGYTIRKTEIITGGKTIKGLINIPRYTNNKLGVVSSINELLITLTLKQIEDIDGNNERRTEFVNKKVRYNINNKAINIIFVRISRADGSNLSELRKNIDKIADFVIDLIYSNPMVDIVTLPYNEFLKDDSTDELIKFDDMIRERISEMTSLKDGGGKIGYFLPSYYTRNGIPELIDNYIDKFGEDGIYICDFDGGTFSGIGYSLISQISRKITNDTKTESYCLYAYSQKEKKKSGNEVSSENLLALLNEVPIVGPSHKRVRLPKEILEKIKQKNIFNPEILNDKDFLFYGYNSYKYSQQFDQWISQITENATDIKLEHKKMLTDIYNTKKTFEAIKQVTKDPNDAINALERNNFRDDLKQINLRMRKIR